jgi:hypothetical protein
MDATMMFKIDRRAAILAVGLAHFDRCLPHERALLSQGSGLRVLLYQ